MMNESTSVCASLCDAPVPRVPVGDTGFSRPARNICVLKRKAEKLTDSDRDWHSMVEAAVRAVFGHEEIIDEGEARVGLERAG